MFVGCGVEPGGGGGELYSVAVHSFGSHTVTTNDTQNGASDAPTSQVRTVTDF